MPRSLYLCFCVIFAMSTTECSKPEEACQIVFSGQLQIDWCAVRLMRCTKKKTTNRERSGAAKPCRRCCCSSGRHKGGHSTQHPKSKIWPGGDSGGMGGWGGIRGRYREGRSPAALSAVRAWQPVGVPSALDFAMQWGSCQGPQIKKGGKSGTGER